MFYVYGHYIPDAPLPFYIGKGSERRARRKTGRSRWWKNIVQKHGEPTVRFLAENIPTEEEAFNIERFWITVLGRRDTQTGILINTTNGGDGVSGYRHTEEIKRKISVSLMGREAHNKGVPHTAETIKRMRTSKIGSKNSFFGKKHSLKTRRKLAEIHGAKDVILVSPDGMHINVFDQREFCRKYSLNQPCINMLINGKRKQHKGWTLKSPIIPAIL